VIRSLFDFDKVDQPSIQMSVPVRTFNCRSFDHIQTPFTKVLIKLHIEVAILNVNDKGLEPVGFIPIFRVELVSRLHCRA
jgi:hypothetical protein